MLIALEASAPLRAIVGTDFGGYLAPTGPPPPTNGPGHASKAGRHKCCPKLGLTEMADRGVTPDWRQPDGVGLASAGRCRRRREPGLAGPDEVRPAPVRHAQ